MPPASYFSDTRCSILYLPSLMMRATGLLLVVLSAPSCWVPPCFCVEGAATARSLAFVTAVRTSTSTARQRSRQQQQQQPPRPRAQPRVSRPRLAAAERGGRPFGGRVGLRAASTGGDDIVSVKTGEPDATIEEERDSPAAASSTSTKSPHLSAYWDILRPQNIPSSFGLVAAGALVASHTVGSILDPKVCERFVVRHNGGVIPQELSTFRLQYYAVYYLQSCLASSIRSFGSGLVQFAHAQQGGRLGG